jgi:hypothetical protein
MNRLREFRKQGFYATSQHVWSFVAFLELTLLIVHHAAIYALHIVCSRPLLTVMKDTKASSRAIVRHPCKCGIDADIITARSRLFCMESLLIRTSNMSSICIRLAIIVDINSAIARGKTLILTTNAYGSLIVI